MEEEAEKIVEEFKALLEKSKKHGKEMKKEIDELFSDSEESEIKQEEKIDDISNAISKINLSQITKLRKFSKGENFSRFCERFREYVCITKMSDPYMYMFFLKM